MNNSNHATKVFCIASILAISIPLTINGYINRDIPAETVTEALVAFKPVTLDKVAIESERVQALIVLPETVIRADKAKRKESVEKGATKSDKDSDAQRCKVRDLTQGSGQVRECN